MDDSSSVEFYDASEGDVPVEVGYVEARKESMSALRKAEQSMKGLWSHQRDRLVDRWQSSNAVASGTSIDTGDEVRAETHAGVENESMRESMPTASEDAPGIWRTASGGILISVKDLDSKEEKLVRLDNKHPHIGFDARANNTFDSKSCSSSGDEQKPGTLRRWFRGRKNSEPSSAQTKRRRFRRPPPPKEPLTQIPVQPNTSVVGAWQSNVWFARQLRVPCASSIWALAMSPDGRHLAVGTQSGNVHIWATKRPHQGDPTWLFDDDPLKTFVGHRATIVCIQWAKHPQEPTMLLSASLDKTVRVWDVNDGLISLLQCTEWPTAAVFHPTVPGFIFTGTLDGSLQVWNLSKTRGRKEVRLAPEMIEFMRVPDLITCLAISHDGCSLSVGTRLGSVLVYDAKNLRFRGAVDCRNRKGRTSNGRKVTGIVWSKNSSTFVVTTGDSRIREVSTKDLRVTQKFKGHQNEQIMLRAHFSTSEDALVCGSEPHSVSIWKHEEHTIGRADGNRRPTVKNCESFKVFGELLTSASVAPETMAKEASITSGTACLVSDGTLHIPTDGCPTSNTDLIITSSYSGLIRVFVWFRKNAQAP